MQRSELEQIRNLRQMANRIQACRKPVPAALGGEYYAALSSLQKWEQAAEQDSLGFLPLVLLGGLVLSLGAITYIFVKVAPEVIETGREAVRTFATVSNVAMWSLLGLGLYNLATKGKLL